MFNRKIIQKYGYDNYRIWSAAIGIKLLDTQHLYFSLNYISRLMSFQVSFILKNFSYSILLWIES